MERLVQKTFGSTKRSICELGHVEGKDIIVDHSSRKVFWVIGDDLKWTPSVSGIGRIDWADSVDDPDPDSRISRNELIGHTPVGSCFIFLGLARGDAYA